MKRTALLLFAFLVTIPLCGTAAQTLQDTLRKFVETLAVTGYEQALAAEIATRLNGFAPKTDNVGNVVVTIGSGAPRRLLVAPLDEPGYIIGGITDDGFLRVQRLPQTAPSAIFDLMHAAQPVVIGTRKGKWISGIVAGLSTHLQGGRQNPPRVSNPDEIYVDIGAASEAEARAAGVDVLDPIAIDRRSYDIGFGRMAGAATGDRFGAAALVELLQRVDATRLKAGGTLIVAFVAQNWAGARGLDRMLYAAGTGGKIDEMIYVGRLRRGSGGGGGAGAAAAARAQQAQSAQRSQVRAPQALPGSGVAIATTTPDAPLTGLAAELKQLAEANAIPAAADYSPALPRGRATEGEGEATAAPARSAHLGVATRWAVTPAEWLDLADLGNLVRLLEAYTTGSAGPPVNIAEAKPLAPPALPTTPKSAPSVTTILATLVESYGISGHEAAVRATVERLLPPWAKVETDSAGNLIVRAGSGGASGKARAPSIVFIAHVDEIGFEVRAVNEDGTLNVQSRGGGTSEFFMGHPVLVHTSAGIRPGVLQLPANWDTPGYEWPRGAQAAGGVLAYRVETGARNAEQVAQLGIKAGDFVTVPKRYRPLHGTRANGRSFDDRVGSTALLAAAWALGGPLPGRDVTFVWSTEEEVGLRGAAAVARQMAADGKIPDYVFAVDTFVSSDSPLESKRFADAKVGKGFVIRAVDNSSITERSLVDKLVALARTNNIAVQYGTTGGGNDGSVFIRYGTVDVGIGWPLRYSHSPGEVIDTRDVEALGRIVAVIARSW